MIALYRGVSFISRRIKHYTRSEYSHAAWLCKDGSVFEAWHRGGVLHNPGLGTVHTPGTVVDIFDIRGLNDLQRTIIEDWLSVQVGKGYDMWGCCAFVFKRPPGPSSAEKWFCSEMVNAACNHGQAYLFNRVEDWQIYPGHIPWSLAVQKAKTITTGKE